MNALKYQLSKSVTGVDSQGQVFSPAIIITVFPWNGLGWGGGKVTLGLKKKNAANPSNIAHSQITRLVPVKISFFIIMFVDRNIIKHHNVPDKSVSSQCLAVYHP